MKILNLINNTVGFEHLRPVAFALADLPRAAWQAEHPLSCHVLPNFVEARVSLKCVSRGHFS